MGQHFQKVKTQEIPSWLGPVLLQVKVGTLVHLPGVILTGQRFILNHCSPGWGWSDYPQCCAIVAMLLLVCL